MVKNRINNNRLLEERGVTELDLDTENNPRKKIRNEGEKSNEFTFLSP